MSLRADFEAEITLFHPRNGGRRLPVRSGFRAQHALKEDGLASGTHEYLTNSMVEPGETVFGRISLLSPESQARTIWIGREIDIVEEGRVIGQARVARIINGDLDRDR